MSITQTSQTVVSFALKNSWRSLTFRSMVKCVRASLPPSRNPVSAIPKVISCSKSVAGQAFPASNRRASRPISASRVRDRAPSTGISCSNRLAASLAVSATLSVWPL